MRIPPGARTKREMPAPRRMGDAPRAGRVTPVGWGLLMVGLAALLGGYGLSQRWFAAAEEARRVRECRLALTKQDFHAAWELASTLQATASDDPAIWRLIAEAAEGAQRPDDAIAAWRRWGELHAAGRHDAATRIAGLEMKRFHVSAAEAALNQVLETAPEAVTALRLRAQLWSVLGRSDGLIATLFQLVKLRQFTDADLAMLASTDPFIADEPRLRDIEGTATEPPPRLARARIAINADRLDEAVAQLRAVDATSPAYWEAQGLLGKLLAERDSDEFLAWHARLPRGADDQARIWLARGIWLKRQGELEPAARSLWEAVRRQPELSAAMTQLALALRMRGEHEASAAFNERAELLQRIRDLATRIEEQQDWRHAGPLVIALEQGGRFWEAWAWSSLLLQQQPLNRRLAEQTARLEARLSPALPRTWPDAIPARQLPWDEIALPDWSKYTPRATPAPVAAIATETTLRFEDQAAAVGLDFRFRNSDDPAVPGRYIFESTGGGVGVLDYDHDGRPDIYCPQAGPWPVDPRTSPRDALYRNRLGTVYQAITESARIVETGFSQGLAVGDFDDDGFDDLYVANIGRNTLLRNNGDGTFTDVSIHAGLVDETWTVSAAFADFNGDALPDLFDVNYLEQGPAFTQVCVNDEGEPRVCRPTLFEPALDSLRINQGDGTFRTYQGEVGLDLPHGMGLGLVVADFNDDRRPDVFIANDQTPNYLLINQPAEHPAGLRFEDQGMLLGVGLDQDGSAQACMGIAHADINDDGRVDLYVTNFSQESNTLYLSQPDGGFSDETRAAGLRAPSFALLGFGTQFLDADNDGLHDLLVLNGHIDEFKGQDYRMRPQLFRGLPGRRFVEATGTAAGAWFAEPRLGRGLATLDWNGDGKLDFVASDLEGPFALGTNRTSAQNRSLRVKLVGGPRSGRDAVGAVVRVTRADGKVRKLQITAGDGYEAASERVVHFGLATDESVSMLEVEWPSGAVSRWKELALRPQWLLQEERSAACSIPE